MPEVTKGYLQVTKKLPFLWAKNPYKIWKVTKVTKVTFYLLIFEYFLYNIY